MPHEWHGASPRVLVLGSGFRAGPWVVRSLRQAGAYVLAAGEGSLSSRSRVCPRPLRTPSPVAHPEDFVEWVADTCRRAAVDVVLPVTEEMTRLMALNGVDLAGASLAGPNAQQYAGLCDKALLGATARGAGVDHPLTQLVAGPHDSASLPLPAIVKPADSGEGIDGVFGVVRADTAAERDRAITTILDGGGRAIVQELLTGTAWVLHGVRTPSVNPLVAARVEVTWPRLAGVSSISHVVPEAERLARTATAVLDAVDYVGPWCINAFERDGRLAVHDVNLRPAASVAAAIYAGLDVPTLGVRAALGLSLPPAAPTTAVAYVNIDAELRGLLAGVREGPRAAVAEVRRIRSWARAPRRLIDPSPVDPFLLAQKVAEAITWLRRLLVRPVRRG